MSTHTKTTPQELLTRIRKEYVESLAGSRTLQPALSTLRCYCMFIGYPRSGHSLVGGLLDAHPNAIIAHELNALAYLKSGFNSQQIYYLLLRNSQQFAARGRQWNEFTYAVPNQWNGRYSQLLVIGDKKGGATTRSLAKNPDLLDKLRGALGIPLRLIHLTRNPFDNISTMARRNQIALEAAADRYLLLAETVARTRAAQPPEEWLDIRYEDFIGDTLTAGKRLCDFLGLEAGDQYLKDCAGIVNAKPHHSRHEAPWTADLIHRVETGIAAFDFLRGYAFHEFRGQYT